MSGGGEEKAPPLPPLLFLFLPHSKNCQTVIGRRKCGSVFFGGDVPPPPAKTFIPAVRGEKRMGRAQESRLPPTPERRRYKRRRGERESPSVWRPPMLGFQEGKCSRVVWSPRSPRGYKYLLSAAAAAVCCHRGGTNSLKLFLLSSNFPGNCSSPQFAFPPCWRRHHQQSAAV